MNNQRKILSYKKAIPDEWKIVVDCTKTADKKLYHYDANELEIKSYISKSSVFFIILKNKIIGFISYIEKTPQHAYLNSLAIKPEYQNQGLAINSLKWLITQIQDKYDQIDLVVHPQNTKAIIVYLKNGFEIKGWKDNYFGDQEPRIKMEFSKKIKNKI